MGIFTKNKQSVTQEELLTEDQKKAQSALTRLANTGEFGNGDKLGEAFGGSLGEFKQDELELRAKDLISGRLGGTNAGLETSAGVLSDLATDEFDEDSPLFRAFTKSIQRAQGESSDVLDRESAITGSRFGTGIQEEKGLLAERGQDALAAFQAEQFQRFLNIRQTSAQSLAEVARLQEGVATGRISQAQAAGETSRMLKDAEAKANLNEFMRQRNEKFGQIDALKTVFNRNVQFGVKDLSSESPSAFTKLLGGVLKAGGSALGTAVGGGIGGAIASKITSKFGGSTSTGGVGIGGGSPNPISFGGVSLDI